MSVRQRGEHRFPVPSRTPHGPPYSSGNLGISDSSKRPHVQCHRTREKHSTRATRRASVQARLHSFHRVSGPTSSLSSVSAHSTKSSRARSFTGSVRDGSLPRMKVRPHFGRAGVLTAAIVFCSWWLAYGTAVPARGQKPPGKVASTQSAAAHAEADGATKAAARALEAARQGALARRRGDIASACQAFEHAVHLTPTWAVAQLELGRCYRLLGDPRGKARSHLELAKKWLPDWSLVHIELGRLMED